MESAKPKLKHSPTLNTVLMVEDALKNTGESAVKLSELKNSLPRKVNHNTLRVILEYLEDSNKIVVGVKGVTWIHNTNPNLKRAVAHGLEI